MSEWLRLAAPCGLYCGVCSTFLEGICHGCGCQAEDCFAAEKHRVCVIYRCVLERGFQDCSSCDDFPCTELIQFAFDPIMRTHLFSTILLGEGRWELRRGQRSRKPTGRTTRINSMSGYHFIKNAKGKEDRYKNTDEFGAGDGI